jgi:hypothetical protein
MRDEATTWPAASARKNVWIVWNRIRTHHMGPMQTHMGTHLFVGELSAYHVVYRTIRRARKHRPRENVPCAMCSVQRAACWCGGMEYMNAALGRLSRGIGARRGRGWGEDAGTIMLVCRYSVCFCFRGSQNTSSRLYKCKLIYARSTGHRSTCSVPHGPTRAETPR